MRIGDLSVLHDANKSDLGELDALVLDADVVSLIVRGLRIPILMPTLEFREAYGFV